MKKKKLNKKNSFFEISNSSWTPSLEKLSPIYRDPTQRSTTSVAPPSTLIRPNYEDLIRRVSLVLHQHILKCEKRLFLATEETMNQGLFHTKQMELFLESDYVIPKSFIHTLPSHLHFSSFGLPFAIGSLPNEEPELPTIHTIHLFLRDLFLKAELSAECCIVSLIYIERLMEIGHVPLVRYTWRPCVLCGLLLASKVWQDLSTWNSEFSQIYPEFSIDSINKLEMIFCREIKWQLYISTSTYAKYYFALRSLTEKQDFRRSYHEILGNAPGAEHVAERSGEVKQSFLNTTLSRSL